MKSTIYLPTICKVGFQIRNDTYSGKLGYVIYHDGKIWRKETSWENWRSYVIDDNTLQERKDAYDKKRTIELTNDYNKLLEKVEGKVDLNNYDRYNFNSWKKQVELGLDAYIKNKLVIHSKESFGKNTDTTDTSFTPLEFKNELIEGFVLNRKAGGGRSRWNSRNTYCRVYDPRGFEIEISIPNLLYILENTNSIVGKGLEGRFMYGWVGKDLVLLPENCPELEEIKNYTTQLNSDPIKFKDLSVGYKYKFANGPEEYTYLGVFIGNNNYSSELVERDLKYTKNHIFSTDAKALKSFSKSVKSNKYLTIKLDKNDKYSDLVDYVLDLKKFQKIETQVVPFTPEIAKTTSYYNLFYYETSDQITVPYLKEIKDRNHRDNLLLNSIQLYVKKAIYKKYDE